MATFEEKLEDCLPDLWRYAFALTRQATLADDLVQDCAERALRKRYMWLPARPLKPWLMKVLLNIYRNQHRRNTFLRVVPISDMESELSVASRIPERLELADAARALAALPDDQREALLLVVLGGLDYRQAARALEIPKGTLMSRISRARANLRAQRSAHDPMTTRTQP